MGLDHVSREWTRLGEQDAMWAVLTDRGRDGRRWTPAEFLATGVIEVESLLERLAALGLEVAKGAALDFGCGAGRLSQALAGAGFRQVTGVDISDSMLAVARRLNRQGDAVMFVHNQRPDLSVMETGSVDLVYSCRVLQHMPPNLAAGYVREFFRVTRPGGVVVFQIPERPKLGPAGLVLHMLPAAVLDRLRKGMQMHGTAPDRVKRIVSGAGGELVAIDPDQAAGHRWLSNLYICRRLG